MKLIMSDFNNIGPILGTTLASEWQEVFSTLNCIKLHLKASDQKGIIGNPIFDAVGTNECIATNLELLGWRKISIPKQYQFFGQGIDFYSFFPRSMTEAFSQ